MKSKNETLIKLCEGYSIQSKTANKFWLVMIVSSIISLTGHPNDKNLISLPFSLGDVALSDFYAISIIMISVVSIAYASAQIQGLRTRHLIRNLINDFNDQEKWLTENLHVKDFVDSALNPTFNRVAPISQFLLGGFIEKNGNETNFFTEMKKIIGAILYFILKVLSLVFVYLIPTYAILKSWGGLKMNNVSQEIELPSFFISVTIVMAIFSLTIVLWGEFKYTIRAMTRIVKPTEKDN